MKKGMIITAAVVVMGMSMPAGLMAANAQQMAAVAQEEVTYEEMEVENLPEAVTKAISDGYADYTLAKAYQGSDGSYKVKLTKDDEKIAVFFNASGEFLKIETVEEPME